ncbi:hypothetical protein CXT76_00315 [Candidatus Parvarchaeota archaeon]|jgi:ribosomal protein S3AE|nr:MAG: hypothetical protein CXT76_00315 [Candidatus Parvarchaeota archaeon]HIG52180.1 hypothetical protein [Candidatus Pacearchaeota archaeon]
MAKVIKKKRKGLRKKFFEVKIPLIATKVNLYNYSPEDLNGSFVKIDLTKKLRGKGLELKSKINLIKGELLGEPIQIRLFPTYIRKMLRKGSDYVEDSFEIDCKDYKIRVKPFMITRKRIHRSTKKAIRELARKHLESKMKIRDVEEIFSEIISNKIQKELSFKVKKIYPLSFCEIRMINIIEKLKTSK